MFSAPLCVQKDKRDAAGQNLRLIYGSMRVATSCEPLRRRSVPALGDPLRAAPRLPVAATWGRAHQLLVPAVVHRIAATFEPAQTAPRQQKDDAATGQNSLVVSA